MVLSHTMEYHSNGIWFQHGMQTTSKLYIVTPRYIQSMLYSLTMVHSLIMEYRLTMIHTHYVHMVHGFTVIHMPLPWYITSPYYTASDGPQSCHGIQPYYVKQSPMVHRPSAFLCTHPHHGAQPYRTTEPD